MRKAWRALGPAPEQGPPESARAAVELLSDPLADLTYGTVCYEDGSAPRGREATELLYEGGSGEALLHALVGPNPEGRVYAADALLMLEWEGRVLEKERKATLRKVLALDVPIRACNGCLVHDAVAARLIRGRSLVGSRYLCRIVERIDDGMGFFDVGVLDILWTGRLAYRPFPRVRGTPARVPVVVRKALPERLFQELRAAVDEGWPFVDRDLVATIYAYPGDAEVEAPPAVTAVLEFVHPLKKGPR